MTFPRLTITFALFLAAVAPLRAQAPRGKPPLQQPLPGISVLMRQVLENQNRIDKLRENYACRDARQVEDLDKHGRVKKTTDSAYQISFFAGREIHRLIEKDGRPLNPKDQKKEDDRIRKEIEKYTEEEKNGKQAERQRKNEFTIQDFLRADRFIHPRRETLDGRPVIAFDFEPNPAFKARTRVEKVAQSLVGTIWIDAQAHEVVRLDAHFAKNFKIGWGLLANVHRGTAVAFQQTLVHDQVWLPTYVQANISGRALFFSLNQNETDRYSDYREFHVTSSSTPFPPHQP